MPAPKGNQFAKGNKGGGRKGFEYEAKQIKEMREILNEALKLGKKVIKGEATKKEISSFLTSTKMVLKIMDKLHATKQESKITGDKGEPFVVKIIDYSKMK
ncbi:unnamed protein product [marine sediment metagenome]|uniref:Uncharacterized protein n=1 Tax=marine sediment metagenome TaxID=412755 RepID=X1NTJ5_9ZZZZ